MFRVQRYLLLALPLCLTLAVIGGLLLFSPRTFWEEPHPMAVSLGGIAFLIFGIFLPVFACRHHLRSLRALKTEPKSGWARFWTEHDSESTSYYADVGFSSPEDFVYRMSFFPIRNDLKQPFEGIHAVKLFCDASSGLPLVLECDGRKSFTLGNPVDLQRSKPV